MLTAINGYSELVLKRISDDDPIRNNVIEIKKAGERSADLTKQLLAFSRKQVLQLKVLNLNEVILETNLLLERLIGEDLILKTELDPALGLVESDSGQLSQVIINLTVNARDAMPKGGIVTIQTTNAVIGNNFEADPLLPPPGSYVQFTVRDNGIGMGKETLENVFEPFFTTKGVGKGTGLGLATVYGIVSQSNGHIFVESVVNEGTVFRIYLPRCDEVAIHESTDDPQGMIKKGTETILIVEDEAMVRALTRQVLEECGYTIFEAENGVEALAKFEECGEEIDMVLTDVIMPLMGGRELGNRLSKIRPEIPILFTSGYADDEDFGEYISEKDANFLAKPFTFEQLANKVREFLDLK
jgi:CheY-like chemotaxis protein